MSKLNHHQMTVPLEMVQGWQNMVNLLADVVDVPAALVMRLHEDSLEVFATNVKRSNPYQVGSSEPLGHGLYCETVLQQQKQLLVEDARIDRDWLNNPDIKLGMVAYCGLPINWPDGQPFGTLCILDSKRNPFSNSAKALLASFRDSIEAQLTILFQHAELQRLNDELKIRVDTRTKDLVDLNYSLNKEIDKRIAAEQKLMYQKTHDLGTGLLNRAALEDELQLTLTALENSQHTAAIIYIGFVNGRRIQSKRGARAWEHVMLEYRQRLGDLSAFHAVVARPTTSDLAILIHTEYLDQELPELVNLLIDVGHSEFELEGSIVHLHSHIGIASSDQLHEGDNLLTQAAEAMQSCKDSGHKYSYYCKEVSDSLKHISQLESYLLQAVRNDDLLVYFQPKVSPHNHLWTGAEALLRWRHPILGDMSNETLIHMAEQNGLIFEVGSFVLRTAIEKTAEWIQYNQQFKIAINVSPVQLKNPQFAEQVAELLTAYELPPACLELEITEGSLISDELMAHNNLFALHQLGVTLSLDDFGTGYASFNYLKKFPFHAIKVDKSFVEQLDDNEEDREIVRSIINVAKKLNLEVTIEGVENQNHEQFLIDEGCEYGQGYFYGKPMPCDEFELNLINQHTIPNVQIR
ncbi:sensor domain-containing phosphodiesterase [Vibrio sp.]|uniref:sensor domain-containing phosphodiesterase n=1 Tax=Vibrio sp. TaxID=678 RepID=UPI003D10D00B